jgi:hypothetical protein
MDWQENSNIALENLVLYFLAASSFMDFLSKILKMALLKMR